MGPIREGIPREGIPMEVEHQELTMLLSDRKTGRPIYWGPLWMGALTALAVAVLIGLIGSALGVQLGARSIASWRQVSLAAAIMSVVGAFFSFVAGGWAAAKLADMRRSDTAMLQGAMVWLLALPILLLFVSLGAGAFGSWYGGLVGSPAWAGTETTVNAVAVRNGALAAITTLLLGLVGAVLGGWLASGEGMRLRFDRAAEHLD